MNATTILASYADRWRNLRAWRAPLPAQISIEPWRGTAHVGVAYPAQCRTTIYQTPCLADDLGTVLHELAHIAAPTRAAHDRAWRELYAAGAAEALALDPLTFVGATTNQTLTSLVREACDRWLTTSGQRPFLRALGVRC